MQIFIQTGFSRNIKEGQKLEVFVNDVKVEIEPNDNGNYLTGTAQRYNKLWYMKSVECTNGDIIRIESKVGLRGLGADEKRTFTGLYQVDETAESQQIKVFGVGFGREFPLLKGPVKVLSFTTMEELRLNKAQNALTENDENNS